MSAQHAPGPWKVCPQTAGCFTVWRWVPGTRGNGIERLRNASGNTKRFRSIEAAYAAIAKAYDEHIDAGLTCDPAPEATGSAA